MSKSKSRVLSLIVLLAFSFVIFTSSLFIIVHADHHCTGEGCAVCTELAECHNTLSALGTAVAGTLPVSLILIAAAVLVCVTVQARSEHTTLISLKVELLN